MTEHSVNYKYTGSVPLKLPDFSFTTTLLQILDEACAINPLLLSRLPATALRCDTPDFMVDGLMNE